MGITLDFAFDRTSSEPVDSSLVLSKAEMLAVNDNMMPETYFAVCKDDKKMYIYDKSATPSAETGKFIVYEGGGGEEGKTYTMDWEEDTKTLTLTDGTTPQELPLTGLQSELTAGDNISIVEDPYTGTTVISSTGGGGGAFVLDTANPCSYNELQSAINAPKVILIKHEGVIYPFVEKWESDEGTKRYVNIASLQRQAADKGAMYFFFEATIGDFDSPMVYSSNFTQPTGKPYTDNIAGNLSNLTTTEKTNLVGAVNEVNGKTGVHFAVGQERWYGTYTDENNVTYQAYTKTIFIPALPATAGITTYPIGVSNMKQIIDIFGTTTDGFKLNAPRQTASDNITIYQVSKGSQTFSIEVGKDRSSKSAYVTIIYAKNN